MWATNEGTIPVHRTIMKRHVIISIEGQVLHIYIYICSRSWGGPLLCTGCCNVVLYSVMELFALREKNRVEDVYVLKMFEVGAHES